MITTRLMLFVALGLTVFVACTLADDNKGPCKGGFWPDSDGCCPEIIDGKAYYRDRIHHCYPRDVGCGVFYADANGCYPDSEGNYLNAGDCCPEERECHKRCIRPRHHSTTEDHHKTTTEERRTTTEERRTTTPERRTTTEERKTTTPRRTTTEERRTTTPERRTTTEERRTTTPERRTTTEERRTTTEERKTTPARRTTTEERRTTTEEHHDNKKCKSGKYPDGNGCCPRKINHKFYYPDGHGCYPIELDCGVFYADGNGCYPDEHGNYLAAGECCPDDRQCCPECDCE